MHRVRARMITAVGAVTICAALAACGSPGKEDSASSSAPSTSLATSEPPVATAMTTSLTATKPAAPATPVGTATTMTITNPDGTKVISTKINPYTGADNGVFDPAKGEVAWWARGSNFGAPGQARTSILSGHVTWDGLPDVFKNLHTAKPGATIEVVYDKGTKATWKVVEVVTAKKEDVASYDTEVGKKVWGSPGLRVITCDEASGKRSDGHTVGNTVLIADRVS